MYIDEFKIGKIFNRIIADLDIHNWPAIDSWRQERWVTKHIVRPVVANTLNQIGEKRLILSSDGEYAPKKIVKYGMSFSPDLDVTFLNQRCIAIEVKLLREIDASGSITKALGQTILYQEFGYENSLCLIFDCRKKKSTQLAEFALSSEYSHNKVKLRCF